MENSLATTMPPVYMDALRQCFRELSAGRITKTEYDRLLNKHQTTHPAHPVSRDAQQTTEEHRTIRDLSADDPGHVGSESDHHDDDGVVGMLIQEFGGHEIPTATTHTDRLAGASQKQRLLAYLSDKAWHNTVQIMRVVYGVSGERGICRIASRVNDLRKEGHKIESKRANGSLWEYRLIGKSRL